jgi:phosphoribosyl-AMP cyclohydrolase / phosphoribosyl-ATP pyrophosphohydrolase
MTWLDQLKYDGDGLVPVVAQEASTGEVLMVAYANREALEHTVASGRAHYWSRSRRALWMKGETSGNVQDVVEVRVDCDADTVLYRVRQTGPACHTMERSCFHRVVADGSFVPAGRGGHILARLEEIVDARASEPEAGSYTAYLFEQGLDKILKKIGEESAEVVIAAKNDGEDELTSEAADLLYHLVVLFRARKLPLEAVWTELEGRFERAPRPQKPRNERNPPV